MSDDPDNIVLKHLRALRDGQTKILERLMSVETEIIALRKQAHSVQGESIRRDESMAALSLQLDRVNSRLDLTDA